MVTQWFRRHVRESYRTVRIRLARINAFLQEHISGMKVVQAFAREDYEQRRLEHESMESVELALEARSLKARLSPIVEVIAAFGTCLVLWFGARLVLSGALSPGSLILFIRMIIQWLPPCKFDANLACSKDRGGRRECSG